VNFPKQKGKVNGTAVALSGQSPCYQGAAGDAFKLIAHLGLQGSMLDDKKRSVESFRINPKDITLDIKLPNPTSPVVDLTVGQPLRAIHEPVRNGELEGNVLQKRAEQCVTFDMRCTSVDDIFLPSEVWGPQGFRVLSAKSDQNGASAIQRLAESTQDSRKPTYAFMSCLGAIPGGAARALYPHDFLQKPSIILFTGNAKAIPQVIKDKCVEKLNYIHNLQALQKRDIVHKQTALLGDFCPEIRLHVFPAVDNPAIIRALGTLYNYAYWVECEGVTYWNHDDTKFSGFYSVEQMADILTRLVMEKHEKHIRYSNGSDLIFRKERTIRAA
jgi:hypothetical protein